MAAAAATLTTPILSPKPSIFNFNFNPQIPIPNPNPKFSLKSNPPPVSAISATVTGGAAILSSIFSSPPAMAAKQIAESTASDNRGLAILLPVIPAVGWVLYNILGPALGQINRMRSEKGVVIGLGLGLCGLSAATSAYAGEIAVIGEAAEAEGGASGGGNKLLLVAFVVAAVFLEVLVFSTTMKSEEGKE